MRSGIIATIVLILSVGSVLAVERKARIPVYVTPYYYASPSPDEVPEVKVGDKFDALLASNDPKEILRAQDLVEAEPDRVSPITMMVLAVRLYDTGSRDEAVFWFYAAKDRYMLLQEVIDMNGPEVAGISEAMLAFHSLAGPFINSYAFCDIDKQRKARAKALDWTKKHPYDQILFWQRLPAKPGDRAENLARAIHGREASVRAEAEQFQDQDFVAEFLARRAESNTDAEFCWAS